MELKQLFENAGLPADFSDKATVLFEAAVSEQVEAKLATEAQKIQEAADQKLEAAKSEFIEQQAKSLEESLDSAIVNWLESNKVALESTLKAELLDELANKLQESVALAGFVFAQPETVQVVESAKAAGAEAQSQVVTLEAALTESNEKLLGYQKAEILAELTESLSDVSAERVARLAENLQIKDLEQYRKTVAIICEGLGVDPTAAAKAGEAQIKAAAKAAYKEGSDGDDKGVVNKSDDEDDNDDKKVVKTNESTDPFVAMLLDNKQRKRD